MPFHPPTPNPTPVPTLCTEQRLQIPRAPQSCHLGTGTHSTLPGMLPEAKRKGARPPYPVPSSPRDQVTWLQTFKGHMLEGGA